MKALIRSKQLWKVVTGGIPKKPVMGAIPIEEELEKAIQPWEETEAKDQTALTLLYSAVTDDIFAAHLSVCESSKAAWDLLKERFQGDPKTGRIKLQRLRASYYTLRLGEKESIKDFANEVTQLGNEMKAFGDEIREDTLVSKILYSLEERFDPYVGVIEKTKDLTTLTVGEFFISLESQELRLDDKHEGSLEGAFQAKFNGLKVNNNRPESS